METILVIDDEPQIRRVVRHALEGLGRVSEAASARQGIDLAAAERPTLIVLDLALPDTDAEWWHGLAELARSTRRVLLARPWSAPLFARPLRGLNAHAVDEALQGALRNAGFSEAETRELHDQLSNMVFALVVPELHGKRNRAAFERGLELLHAGLEARLDA